MDIFSFITLFGGLAFFLYGMTILSSSLERMAGGKLEKILKKITSSKIKGLLVGIGITAAIQSSSALTVMLVGLVNSNIMSIEQSVGVIMGSHIGTTVTAWILTLSGIESSNVFVSLLKPENFSLIFAFIGVMFIMTGKTKKKKDIGNCMIGFALIMYGMKIMSSAVKPLAESESFTSILLLFQNPFLGVLVGLLVTAIIQSSAASVGILQALATTGNITYGAAIPIIMGQNIGTCVTAFLSSIGVSKNAKRVSVIHVSFSIIGTAICLTIYCIVKALFNIAILSTPIGIVGIATCHTLFNVLVTVMLYPFSDKILKLSEKIIKENAEVEEAQKEVLLDERLLSTPSMAISECEELINKMAKISEKTVMSTIEIMHNYTEEKRAEIVESENILDSYEDKIGNFLVKLSSMALSDRDSIKVSSMLRIIVDFERIGDHAVNLMFTAKKLNESKSNLSEVAQKELSTLYAAVTEILQITIKSYIETDLENAEKVEPLEEVIDNLVNEIENRHIVRLQKGKCKVESGIILNDILADYERIGDHCSNIAVIIIQMENESLLAHKYLRKVKEENETFKKLFEEFAKKYVVE